MGKTDFEEKQMPAMLMTMRVILLALFSGVVIFGVIVALRERPVGGDQLMGFIMLSVAVPAVMMRFIMPGLIVKMGVHRIVTEAGPDAELAADMDQRLAQLFQARMIVAGALLEGAAFMVLTGYMISGFLPCLIVAGPLALGILVDFPTAGRLLDFIARQKRRIKEDRLFG